MNAVNAIKTGLEKSFTFNGRASRSGYWRLCVAFPTDPDTNKYGPNPNEVPQ
jgi:uncharacterized membrane protein YhaH (DUF805 family)